MAANMANARSPRRFTPAQGLARSLAAHVPERVMRELPVRLAQMEARPRRQLWRDGLFFAASFVGTFYASVLMLEHAAALMA
jgi:hypothetical protein